MSPKLGDGDCDHCIERVKSQLLVDLSHEFRTPLTLILGPLADVGASRYGKLPATAVEQIELAHRSAERLHALVGQILDAANLDAGGLKLRVRRVDLGEMLRDLAEDFRTLAERRGLALAFTPPEGPLPLWCDPDQLIKVFSNLLANALRYSPNGGRVEIEVAQTAGTAAVTVRDQGPGVAVEDRERIFDRFYRATRLPRRGKGGTGLGLPLARQLAELHGGTLKLENAPGEGAVFRVDLRLGRGHFDPGQIVDDAPWRPPPRSVARAAGAAPASPAGRTGDGAGSKAPSRAVGARPASPVNNPPDRTTVLVVDDHSDIRSYVLRQLEPRYRVAEAADGAEGLALARELLPDLVIADVMMPELDGHALCRALKQDPELDWVPVVLLTARAALDDKLEGLDHGADAYLTKPFDARELVARVDNLIASRRKLRQRFAGMGGNGRPRPPLPLAPGVQPVNGDREWLERVRETIEEGLDDDAFTVEALAAALAIHRGQLHKRLKQLTGKTPMHLVARLRLDRAATMLGTEAVSVSEAAYAAGFRSVAHFSHRFKERFGRSPSAWRRAKHPRARLDSRVPFQPH